MAINSGSTVGLEGFDELAVAFKEFGDRGMENLKASSDEAAAGTLKNIQNHLPVGELRNSLYVKKKALKKGVFSYVCYITWPTSLKYPAPLELGHRLVFFGKKTDVHIPEHPFMRPGADESKEMVVNKTVAAMNKTIDEMGGKR